MTCVRLAPKMITLWIITWFMVGCNTTPLQPGPGTQVPTGGTTDPVPTHHTFRFISDNEVQGITEEDFTVTQVDSRDFSVQFTRHAGFSDARMITIHAAQNPNEFSAASAIAQGTAHFAFMPPTVALIVNNGVIDDFGGHARIDVQNSPELSTLLQFLNILSANG